MEDQLDATLHGPRHPSPTAFSFLFVVFKHAYIVGQARVRPLIPDISLLPPESDERK